MRVGEKYKKRLNFKLFILAILSNAMVMAQTATVPLTNNYATVYNTNEEQNVFWPKNPQRAVADSKITRQMKELWLPMKH